MLTTCSEPGCPTLVMGDGRCIEHERAQVRVFVRGRPVARIALMPSEPAGQRVLAVAASDSPWHTSELRKAHTRLEQPR